MPPILFLQLMPSTPPTLAAFLLAASTASAAITIDTVLVGDAGNPINPAVDLEYKDDSDYDDEYGDVAYEYRIGKYEVTNSQYTAFLNAVAKEDTHKLYNVEMRKHGIVQAGSPGNWTYRVRSGFERNPVSNVSFLDAARFANWLTNGQPTGPQAKGTTETGAYTLTTDGMDHDTVTRGSWYDAAVGNTSDKTVFAVPSEDEWYKAAYYDGYGAYTDYPTQSYTAPTAEEPPGGKNSANYDDAVGSVTEVGAYTKSESYYGTFDQAGNVLEWTEALVSIVNTYGNEVVYRLFRGGSFASTYMPRSTSSPDYSRFNPRTAEGNLLGFRVTSLTPIPAPSD